MAYFGLKNEADFERWLKPFAARVRRPGYELVTFESTRLFFHLYWKLQTLGYSEQQIADYAVSVSSGRGLPWEVSLVEAVFELAEVHELQAGEPFVPFLAA